MEEILPHLGCMKPCKVMGKTTYQLVQDFFHQRMKGHFCQNKGVGIQGEVFSKGPG